MPGKCDNIIIYSTDILLRPSWTLTRNNKSEKSCNKVPSVLMSSLCTVVQDRGPPGWPWLMCDGDGEEGGRLTQLVVRTPHCLR